jgi:hypothetical protein
LLSHHVSIIDQVKAFTIIRQRRDLASATRLCRKLLRDFWWLAFPQWMQRPWLCCFAAADPRISVSVGNFLERIAEFANARIIGRGFA